MVGAFRRPAHLVPQPLSHHYIGRCDRFLEAMNVVRRPYGAQVLDGLLPLTCPGCGGRGEPVCPACAASLRRSTGHVRPPAGVDEWVAAFDYRGVARELVARAKYRNMAVTREDQVQRGHHFAIVDEVDFVLVDEARTPLIISGRADDAQELYYQFAGIVKGLTCSRSGPCRYSAGRNDPRSWAGGRCRNILRAAPRR